ncbi:hypothetical protein ASF87_16670 [Microbacterium sp. Leaf161]|uniref:hypothetical protein n=1 Tax=Microbacterium sp. Leaf161 TaxID=1736281 RepID=UPI0006FA9B13|nr:hypothetical protein [Microbacterium sp. Leaf161]KQR43423.1 hypothetical protein ASF87_16670 [Microbacterium sp. Leaf161]
MHDHIDPMIGIPLAVALYLVWWLVEWRDGRLVQVHLVRCARCFARIAEEVIPVAELHQSDD